MGHTVSIGDMLIYKSLFNFPLYMKANESAPVLLILEINLFVIYRLPCRCSSNKQEMLK